MPTGISDCTCGHSATTHMLGACAADGVTDLSCKEDDCECGGYYVVETVTTTVPPVPVDPALARKLSTAAGKAREWTEERNHLVREAHEAGGGAREIARLVGLTHPAVLNIIKPRAR